ncbi:MAG: galactokinase [Dermatophilaceae bacterium]
MALAWHRPWACAEGAGAARELFGRSFDAAPAGVWAAPGRVNLVGEHVDYNGGPCLPVALAHRTYVALRPRTDGAIRLVSAARPQDAWTGAVRDLAPGAVDGWAGYAAGPAWALGRDGVDVPGFDAAVASCLPIGAGLSSSAALEGAVALALDDVLGLSWASTDAGRARLAAACVRGENELAGAPTGGMDQAAALRTRAGHALLFDSGTGEVSHVPFDPATADLAVLAIDTRVEHRLADGQYAARRASCEAAAQHLGVPDLAHVADLTDALARLEDPVQRRRVRHVITEIARVGRVVEILQEGALGTIGPVLDSSHLSLSQDFEVSCSELDLAVDAARRAGALGARMTGGGFGGCAIALVPAGSVDAVAAEVAREFAGAGFGAPAFLVADGGAAGGRVA